MLLVGKSIERRHLLIGASAAVAAGIAGPARAANTQKPEQVATFTEPHQVTGVAVSRQGRIFVNFPRWEQDVPISVAELGSNGQLTPYPDTEWNAYRDKIPLSPASHFVCVQSVVVDPHNHLWVVDPAAPGLTFQVKHGPKLVRIDLATNKVAHVYPLDETLAPQGTYLNDIPFTPDGKRAVITNSGHPGSLLTLDVESGRIRRLLANDPSTQHDPGFVITVHGQQLRKPDGQPAQFNADSLAVDTKGEYVYWQASSGDTLHRLIVDDLFNDSLSPSQLGKKVETIGRTVPADGLWMARNGAFFFTDYAESAVKRRLPDGHMETAVRDERLLWPDSMAEGPDDSIYVTTSNIPHMRTWQGPGVKETALFRFKPR